MIKSLRTRHRWMVLGLAVIVLPLFAAGLVLRSRVPRSEAGATGEAAASASPVLFEAGDPFGELGIAVHTVRAGGSGATPAVVLRPQKPLKRPDLLVYWSAASEPSPQGLPPDAYLLGRMHAVQESVLELPAEAARRDGTLILYSLPRQELVASAVLRTAGAAGDVE